FNKLGAGNSRGKEPALVKRDPIVIARVEHEGRSCDSMQQFRNVQPGPRFEQLPHDFSGACLPGQFIEPVPLLLSWFWYEPSGEDFAKHRIVLAPSEAGKIDDGPENALALRIVAAKCATNVAAKKNKLGNTFWMPHAVRDANRRALRDPKKGEGLTNVRSFHDGFQIPHPRFDRQIPDIPVGHAATALVISNESKVLTEELHPVAPHGAFPLVLEMRQPVRRFD